MDTLFCPAMFQCPPPVTTAPCKRLAWRKKSRCPSLKQSNRIHFESKFSCRLRILMHSTTVEQLQSRVNSARSAKVTIHFAYRSRGRSHVNLNVELAHSLARVHAHAGGYHPQWHGPSADVWAPPRAAGGSAGEDGAKKRNFRGAIFLSCETRSFAKTRSRLTERKVEQKAGCFSQSEEAQRVTRWCQWARWDY